MPPRREPPSADTAASPGPEGGPPFYIAATDLYVHNPEAAALPARAFAPGDRVPADLVDAYGWWQQVTAPESEPAAPPAPPSPPRSAPAAVPSPPDTASKE